MISRPTDFSDIGTYSKLLVIWQNQQRQEEENKRNHDDYATAAKNWLVQAESQKARGFDISPKPILPTHKQYNDDGTVTETPFPDLVVPFLTTPNAPSTGSIVNKDAPLDRTDHLLIAVAKLQFSLDQITAALITLLNK